jgi:hypothetical protein
MINKIYFLIFSVLFIACQDGETLKSNKKIEFFKLNDSISIEYHFDNGQLMKIKNILNQHEVIQLVSFHENGKLNEFKLAERPFGSPMRPYNNDSSMMAYIYQFQYLFLDTTGNAKNAQISHDFEQVYSGFWK